MIFRLCGKGKDKARKDGAPWANEMTCPTLSEGSTLDEQVHEEYVDFVSWDPSLEPAS